MIVPDENIKNKQENESRDERGEAGARGLARSLHVLLAKAKRACERGGHAINRRRRSGQHEAGPLTPLAPLTGNQQYPQDPRFFSWVGSTVVGP